jgi:hypothetical protein
VAITSSCPKFCDHALSSSGARHTRSPSCARALQIIDATVVSTHKQHNSREENEAIKESKTPEDWKSNPAKNRQKDKDAR